MIKTANAQSILEAAQAIKSGDLVGMPTETVYGLAADATNDTAVAKIFEAKTRPQFNPLISHVESLEQAESLAMFDERARIIASYFWPGPLTLVLKRKPESPISKLVTAGLETIAIRCPAHKIARDLIKQAGVPIAAPSANLSGKISATTPEHVADQLGDKLALILAAGATEKGLESTVLDLTKDTPILLRPGSVTMEELEEHLGVIESGFQKNHGEKPASPGLLQKHYAPSIPVRLNAVDVEEGEALLAFGSIKFMGIQGGGFAKDLPEYAFRNLSENSDMVEAAANLFAMLHQLDHPKNKRIAVMAIPETSLGLAINDRLKRAAENNENN